MQRPSAGRRTAWRLPALPLVRAILVILLLTAAVASSVSDAKESVLPEHAASVSLCQDVDTTLQQVTSALESCGVSAAQTGTRVGRSNNTSAIQNVDLSPMRRLMRMLGCDTSGSETLARGDTDIHATKEHGTGVAQQDTASSTIQHGATQSRLLPENRIPKATTAHPAKRQTFQRAYRRARRHQPASTGECAFQDIVNGTCSGPDSSGHLNITFHTKDRGVPQDADAQPLRQWSETVGNLTITGAVHEAPLRWLLDNGTWSAVTRIELEGLQFRGVSFEMLNAFSGLREIRLRNNNPIDISAAGFAYAAQIKSVEVMNSSLTQIPGNTFMNFSGLEFLNLEHNLLTNISSDAFSGLSSLADLNLRFNLIDAIDKDAFFDLKNLRVLSLWGNNLATLSSTIFSELTALQVLDLDENALSSLPNGLFSSLRALQVLKLNDLRLVSIPDGIFDGLSMLRTLGLSGNRLVSLHEGAFRHLSRLTRLWLGGNQISVLHPNSFGSLRSLEQVDLDKNRLSALSPELFHNCTNLAVLGLSQNQFAALPRDMFIQTRRLEVLFVEHNQITSLDDALESVKGLRMLTASGNKLECLNSSLPKLEHLVLRDNPIVCLPDVANMPNLTTLRMAGHRMATINLTPLLRLERLGVVELSASSSVTSAAMVDIDVLAAWTGNMLRTLRITNVDISSLLVHDLPSWRLETLDIGWPGLDEQLISPKRLCSLLGVHAHELGIRGSGYKHIELCPNVHIADVNLQHNTELETVTASHSIVQLNVSRCDQLRMIHVPSVEVLDMSYTGLQSTRALCDTLGHSIVFARGVVEDTLDEAAIGRCLQKVDLLDLSDNAWLQSPMKLNEVVGDTVVVSTRDFVTLDSLLIPSRSKPPVFQLHQSPVECTAIFQGRELMPLAADDAGRPETELVYLFQCECAQGHKLSSGKCVKKRPPVAAIVTGSVFGGLVLGLLLVFLYRRYHHLTTRLGEHRQLLLETHEEVLALKKAWEIGFDELRLTKRVAAGASGVVYKAEWDTVTVAVKVLQQGVMAFDESGVAEFEKEVEFLQRTRHPHVVRFFGAGTDPSGSPFLVLEFVALGALKDVLQKGLEAELSKALAEGTEKFSGQDAGDDVGVTDVPGEDLTLVTTTAAVNKRWSRSSESGAPITTVWDLKLRLLQDVASGMAFIHSLGQVHRDLKSGNVLVSANLRAKITDFGSIRQCFSRNTTTRETVLSSASSDPVYSQALGLTTTVDMAMTAAVGTPLYMAPEALTGSSYDSQADVFSFGVLMWEVALQRVPDLIQQEMGPAFCGPLLSTLDNLLRQGKRLSFAYAEAADVPDWYVRVCRRCMAWDPTERPTFEELNASVLRYD